MQGRLMKKGLRQSQSSSITSESHEIRKNRCDCRTKNKNIYADLKVCVDISGSQALSRKGFQGRKNYRLLKESVDATRSQSFSETQKPQKRRGKASLSYIRRWKSLEKLRKGLAFHILAIREARISHKNLPEGLSPSYLRFSGI